jgi:hypothetical protein
MRVLDGINLTTLRKNLSQMDDYIRLIVEHPTTKTRLPYYVGGSRERLLQLETLDALGMRPVFGSAETGDAGALYALDRNTTKMLESREGEAARLRKYIADIEAERGLLLSPVSAAQLATITDAAA